MIRTQEELIDKVAADLIWRRKELTLLKSLVDGSKDDLILSNVLLRSSIALLYAHWEGFVKKSSHYYLEYIAGQRLPYSKLTTNFVAMSIKSKFKELGGNEKLSAGNYLADFFCNSLSEKSNIPYKKGIDTKSNLSSEVLIDIISALGFDISQFETKLKFIDANLLLPRNNIAHGQELYLTLGEYEELHNNVITLIETFRNQIDNATAMKLYEKQLLVPS